MDNNGEDKNLIEMGDCSFVRMMSKVLNNPNGKTYYERLSEEFVPFAKLLLNEYKHIAPIKFNVPPVTLYDEDNEAWDDKTFQSKFHEFENICEEVPRYLESFLAGTASIETVIDYFNKYLSSYYLIARDAIFSPDNYHISTIQFRNLDCFKKLILFPIIYKNGLPDRISYLEPTALHNIINTIEISRALYKKGDVTNTDSIIYSILLNKTQKRFYRDFIYNKEAYNVFPCSTKDNSYQSDLKVTARKKLSSVKKVNVSSIFDRIVPIIKEKTKLNKENLYLSISLVGLVEKEDIEKLSMNILSWYAMLEDLKPKLNLTLTIYSDNYDSDKEINDGENSCKVCFKPSLNYRNYQKNNFAIKNEFEQIVNSSDIIFVLNCHWLKWENYELLADCSLNSFGKILKSYDYKLKKYEKEDIHSLNSFINIAGFINEIVSNYVRMNAFCNTNSSGKILWSFGSSLYEKMSKIIKNSQDEKLLYIYLSDDIIECSDYNELLTGTLLRSVYDIEYHYGNLFYVVKESNSKEKILSSGDNANFVIPLNGFIDSIPINYKQLQESFNISLNNMDFDVENVCRNIYIVGKVKNEMESLEFDIRLGPALNKFDDKTKEKILKWGTDYCKDLLGELKFLETKELDSIYCPDQTLFYKRIVMKTFMNLLHNYAQNIKTLAFYEKLTDIKYFETFFSPKYNLQPIKESFFPVTADKFIYDIFAKYRNFIVEKDEVCFENFATEVVLSECPDNYDYGVEQHTFDNKFKIEEKIFEYYISKIVEAFEELGYIDYHDKIKAAKKYLHLDIKTKKREK